MGKTNTNVDKVRRDINEASMRIEYERTHDHHGNSYGSTLSNPCNESFEKWYSRVRV